MRKLVVAAILMGLISEVSSLAEEKTFQVDPVHSSVQFRIRHLYSMFAGRFNKFEGTISGNPEEPTTMKVSASVDVTSIDTANADREKHLRTPDFFDTTNYPKATFVSTRTTLGDTKDSGAVTGKLTIRGITKEVTFRGQFLGSGPDPRGTAHAGFHATTIIDRLDFGVAFGAPSTNGPAVLGSEVELILDLDTVEAKAPPAKAK